MPVTQDRLTRLREFGLSEYAARSYLALLDLGIAEARDVSSISKVPQAKIYHVLEQLHDKGLVVILPEFPKKYAPVPFEEYLGRIYDEHTKAAKAIDESRGELAEMFRVMGDTDVGDRGFFTVIRGRRNVLARIEEMIGQTQKELIILGTAGTASRAAHMFGELRRARERGVTIRALAPVDETTVETLPGLAQHADLRARELGEAEQSGKVAIVVSDAERAFLIHFVPDDENLYAGKDIGVFTDQEAMVSAIQAIVEPHWARATTFEERRDELLHGRVPEFTRIYTSDEEARDALVRALQEGAKDVASVGWNDLLPEHAERWRGVESLTDARAVEARAALVAKSPQLELRHLRTPMIARKVVVDAREALFRIGGANAQGGRSEVIIHTNAQPVVQAMRAHFETLWSFGSSLEERRQELEIFPGLQPGDIGIGRLFHMMRDAVVVADLDKRVLMWNPAAVTIFARGGKEARGLDLEQLIAPAAREAFVERLAAFVEKAQPGEDADFFETTGLRPQGDEFPMEVTMSLLSTPEGARYLVLVTRDITARRLVQEARNEANERVRRAYERMTEAFYALDRDFRFVYRNPVVKAMQGSMSDSQIDGQVLWDAFPDLAGTKFEKELKRAMRERKPVRFEDHYPRMDRWFEVSAYPSDDGLSVYYRDVTETKRSQEALGRSAAMLAATLDATTDGILVISADGRISGHNERFREMWRIPAEVIATGEDARALDAAAKQLVDPEGFLRKVQELYASPDAESFDVLRFKDGRVFERVSKPQRLDGQVVGRVWSFRDVTGGQAPEAKSTGSRRNSAASR